MKYRDLFNMKKQSQLKFFKILKSELTQKEIESVLKLSDESWLKHLNFDFKSFRFSRDHIPKIQEIIKPSPKEKIQSKISF